MTLEEFNSLMANRSAPVVLVEGTRNLPESDTAKLVQFGKWLAETYPRVIFRTGNAKGSDEAFANGVGEVDPARIQYVVPYAGHRRKAIGHGSYQVALNGMSSLDAERIAERTVKASPQYGEWRVKRDTVPSLRAKMDYILRDTLKVMGALDSKIFQAIAGIFYVNPDDPMKGGTGHTIRVCRDLGVPVAFQDEWMKWPMKHGGAADDEL